MKFFSKKVEGDLSLNYNSLAGFTLGWLPFSERSLKMAFPHLTVKAQDVPAYARGRTEPGFALYADDQITPAFTINSDSNSGYAYAVTVRNAQPLCIGKYRVGETRLSEFNDEHLTEAGFLRDGSKITVFSGISDCDCTYTIRFIFAPPQDWTGKLESASEEVWGNAILTEALFYISQRKIRPQREVTEAQGLKLLKKHKARKTPNLIKQGPNLSDGNPIALLKRQQYSPVKAKNSYLKLADLAVYNAPIDEVKTKIKAIFKTHEKPQDVLFYLGGMYHDDFKTTFMFTLDWKAEIIDLAKNIEFSLGDGIKYVELPALDSFPDNSSVALQGVFESYAKALGDAGFDLWFMDSQSDTHTLFIARNKDRKTITKLFEATHLLNKPIEV